MELYVDKTAIMNVIGCLLKDTSLLSNEEYVFSEEDFSDKLPKIIYGALNNLYIDGVRKFDLVILDEYLSKIQAVYPLFKAQGAEYIQHCLNLSALDNFPYYYDRMKKFTLLRTMNNFGINMKWFYDPSIPVLNVTAIEQQETKLNNTSLVDIGILIDKHIDEIKLRCVAEDNKVGLQAADGLQDLLDRLKVQPEVGIPMYGKFINTITKGARLSKFYLRSAMTGVGKAIPNDTIIPTPTGMRRVDSIKIGDLLFDRYGQPTRVTGVYPQEEKKQVYKITFHDGRIAKCCGEHLWAIYDKNSLSEFSIRTAQDLYKITQEYGYQDKDGVYTFKIPSNNAVEYPKKNLPIDPYALGIILGCITKPLRKDTQKLFKIRQENIEVVKKLAELMNWTYARYEQAATVYAFKEKDEDTHWLTLEDIWNKYPVLNQEIKIPDIYLTSGYYQRTWLLKGLLEAGGLIGKKMDMGFVTDNFSLVPSVITLCNSLGFIAFPNKTNVAKTGLYRKKRAYIEIQASYEAKINLFNIGSKLRMQLEKKREFNLCAVPFEYNKLSIVNIEATGDFADMTCFTVDNPESLFLMNDYIVTHNTRTMIADACSFACNELFDRDIMKWVQNGSKEPTLFITTEQEVDEVQTMLVSFIADVDEDKILDNEMSFDEMARVAKAIEIIKESPLYIVPCPDFSLQDIENIIKINIKKYNIRYILYDYIHTSMKILEEITKRSGGVKLREDNILFMLSVTLKDLCNKYDVFILSSTQLNGDAMQAKEINQNLLRGRLVP